MGKGLYRSTVLLGMFLVFGLLAGCMGHSPAVSTPSWFLLKSGAYDAAGERVFFGIGQAAGVQNLTLLRATADNHARKELAEVLEDYVDELARSASLDLDPGWLALSADEHRQALGMLVRSCLQQAVVSDHWNDAQKPRLLSLCRLDMTTFKQILSSAPSLDEKIRSAMLAEAEKVHAQLSQK